MKAQDLQFTQLIQGAKQFIIPIFQRTYSWDVSHCEQLWNDIVRVGSRAELDSHFIGSAVYIPEQETSAAISRWLVIDGQQRITTITLLLLALMRRLKKENLDDPVSAAGDVLSGGTGMGEEDRRRHHTHAGGARQVAAHWLRGARGRRVGLLHQYHELAG